MYISVNSPSPSIIHEGNTTVQITYAGFVSDPGDNDVTLTLRINGDPNVVFVVDGNEASQIQWPLTMATTKKSYQKSVVFRVKSTPETYNGCSLTLNAKDSMNREDNSGTHIDYV